MNGQGIKPISVVMPVSTGEVFVPAAAPAGAADVDTAPAFDQARADKLWCNRVHDYMMSFVPMSDSRKDDIMRAANFAESDHVS